MKKTLLFLLAVFPTFCRGIVDAQVGDFDKIKGFDLIEVNLIQLDENRILIKDRNVDDVVRKNKKGIFATNAVGQEIQDEDTFIEVLYKKPDSSDGNGGGSRSRNEMLKTGQD